MSVVRFTDVVPPPPRAGWPGPVSFAAEEGTLALVATLPGVAASLIRLAAGLRQPVDGTVEVLGVRPGALRRWEIQRFRRQLGIGFDDPAGLVSNLTLRMNLVIPMVYSGLSDADTARRRADELIDGWELGRWASFRPADVPPAIRRETVLARAVVRDPALLLLEEPTAGLREERAAWLLSRCRERAGTVVVVTAGRDGVEFEAADAVILLDTAGIETGNGVGVA